MGNKVEFYMCLRGIISFISEEIEKVSASQGTKEKVLDICNDISVKVLHNIGELNDDILLKKLDEQLLRFDNIIKELENNDNEKAVYMLLITHVADIFNALKKELTEINLLKAISEDVGRLSNIENTLQEEGENLTIYNRIRGIEMRTYETVNVLFSIKRLVITLTCLSSGILILLLLFFLKFFFKS